MNDAPESSARKGNVSDSGEAPMTKPVAANRAEDTEAPAEKPRDTLAQRIRRQKLIDATTWKFAIVGVINTIVGTAVMFLAYNWLGFGYWVSSALNYIIGSIVSFVLNKYFTFQNKERSVKQVLLFIANIALCYLVAYGMAKPIVHNLMEGVSVKVADNVSMVLGMVLFVILNYAGQRWVVFQTVEKL